MYVSSILQTLTHRMTSHTFVHTRTSQIFLGRGGREEKDSSIFVRYVTAGGRTATEAAAHHQIYPAAGSAAESVKNVITISEQIIWGHQCQSQPRKMASKCPPRPLAAPPLCAWAHVQRGRDGQHLPLSRDAAGARGAGISLGGAVHCRAWLVGATRRKPANTPCTAARSAPLLLTLPPQGQSSFRFKASTRASAGRSPRFPTQDTLGWGRKRGLLAAISDWRSPRLAGCRSILHSADSAVLDQVIPVIYIYRNLAAVILGSC